MARTSLHMHSVSTACCRVPVAANGTCQVLSEAANSVVLMPCGFTKHCSVRVLQKPAGDCCCMVG
jgi:hypothetical protein